MCWMTWPVITVMPNLEAGDFVESRRLHLVQLALGVEGGELDAVLREVGPGNDINRHVI